MISLIEIRMSFSQISQDYLESLEHKHILLFHEEQKNAEKVEFDFIKSGLEKNQRCFYTTNDPEELKKRMQDFGIPVNENIQNGVLNIVPIPKTFEEYSKMIEQKVASLPKNEPIRVVSTHYFDFDSDKKTESMEKIEQWVDDNFEKIPGNFICSFHVASVTKELVANFMKNLLDSHHSVLVISKDNKVETFNFP
jgi:hypothetical protein